MKKDELVALCKQYGISGYSKLKKDELVALLTQAMDTGAPSQAAAPEAPAAIDIRIAPPKAISAPTAPPW